MGLYGATGRGPLLMVATSSLPSPRREVLAESVEYRLTPGMASRRLQVVSFVLQYLRRWGEAPSYGEIAAALAIDRSTARDCVRRAVAKGQLVKGPGGRRALLPPADAIAVPARIGPEHAAELLAQLRAQGYIMDGRVDPGTRTNCPLPGARELDHIPVHDAGELTDGSAARAA